MSEVNVQTDPTGDDRSLPIFARIDKVFDRVRQQACRRYGITSSAGA